MLRNCGRRKRKDCGRAGVLLDMEAPTLETAMTKSQIDEATVMRIAHLARVKVSSAEAQNLERELNGILAWVEELNAIPTEGVTPLTSAGGAKLHMRADIVTDGGKPGDIVKNAPKSEDNYFLVPKVIE